MIARVAGGLLVVIGLTALVPLSWVHRSTLGLS